MASAKVYCNGRSLMSGQLYPVRITIIAFLFIAFSAYGGGGGMHHSDGPNAAPSIDFIKNEGQWHDKIKFRSELPAGKLYIESGKLTYVFYAEDDLRRVHELSHSRKPASPSEFMVDAHLFSVSFPGSDPDAAFAGKQKRPNYNNYFLGRNRKYWATDVPLYAEIYASNLWKGIDYRLYSSESDLKYDFILHPGSDPSKIRMKFSHLDNITLRYGNLYLETSVNEMIDLKPVAYQDGPAGQVFIECEYRLNDGEVTFHFPGGYDNSKEIVIDPKIVFSSYTGATQDNWGYTATFDAAGNLFGGGIVFSDTARTYPTTSGAFQVNQAGGGIDIGITKFSPDGTSLVYSTYLGGAQNEIPHSLVVNSKNQLIIMGTTSSPDFPVTPNAYDTTYNISGSASINVASRTFVGSDIVLTMLSAGGNALVGSTYVGGTGFDGFNYNNLKYNYGDDVRGEVVTDQNDAVYVASTTSSLNFPVTNSSVHRGGTQDAVVFKMDTALRSLVWSTYLGGNGNDAAYSLQVDDAGLVYVAGGTASNNFPTTAQTIHPSPLGGIDGFLTVIAASGFAYTSSTRLGTSSYDQAYFVQLDDSNNVFVTGQTTGLYPVTPTTVYSNPFSSQFIHKLTPGLDSTVFSTVIGNGGSGSSVTVDISPSAFLVNQCNHIYLSGWGGDINATYSNATASTTTGLPVTPGAHKTSTDGNDFYLIVLDENADSLLYATFFGGTSGSLRGEHVDGGTSRFDKKGIVYQAVCAGCGGTNTFPTTPNVWSTTNGSYNCNMGVIKFDLSQMTSQIGMSALTKVCIPGSVAFKNSSNGGNNFYWDFGDGNTSTAYQPTHTYTDTGIFTVMLVVSDSLSCIVFDTTYVTIRGEAPPVATADTIPVICPGDSIQLRAYGGTKYLWIPSTGLSNDTIDTPLAFPPGNMTYMVVVGDSCGSDTSNYFAWDTAFVDVVVAQNLTTVSPDDTVCKGESILLSAGGGQQYLWSPPTYLNKSNVPNPLATPLQSIVYTISITDQFNCLWTRSLKLHVEDSLNPGIITHEDTTICKGDTATLFCYGGITYLWKPGALTSDSTSSDILAWPSENTTFLVTVTSKCFKITDTVDVVVNDFKTLAMPDTFACKDVGFRLTASPGEVFVWQPAGLLDSGNTGQPFVYLTSPSTFTVVATDSMGCSDEDTVLVDLKPAPYVSAGNDQLIYDPGTRLEAKGSGKFLWEPSEFLSCAKCAMTDVEMPNGSVLFTVTLTDQHGCRNTDDVLVTRLRNDLFVPNSFTPNSDMKNDVFRPLGYGLENYKLTIFNRWGQVIFVSLDFEGGWDGTYGEEAAENGIYVWEISYFQNGTNEVRRGTVSLVR